MANFETNIEEMMNQLNVLKESAFNANVSDLSKSQITVQSMDSDEVVIHFNLNQESIESSICDQNNGNKSQDNSSNNSNESNGRMNGKSHNSANGSNTNEDNDYHSNEDSPTKQFKTNKNRSSRSRTISESNNEESKKGILKYSHNWIRRTVSESHCDSVDPDLDILTTFWHSVEDFSDDEFCSDKKPKKNVRFSENISKTIFRPNSSILGRKLKNQKRKNRKNSNRKNSQSSDTEVNKNTMECERTRQDSGYDSEDNALQYQSEVQPLKPHNKSISGFEIETGIENLSFN